MNKNTILVNTSDLANARGKTREIDVDVLGDNINLFIMQLGNVLDKTPDKINKFKLTDITISAEISAKGSLVLLGTGIETEGKGGITFTFKRSS